MEPKRVDPITGVLQFMSALRESILDSEKAFQENRATATTTKLHNDTVIIDTCYPLDTRIYETGIKREKMEGKWVIVEQYENKAMAEKGHQKWVNILTEYPDYPLKDIDMWNLDKLKGKTK